MMKPAPPDALGRVDRRRIALFALVDVRTLDRALLGERVQPLCIERIRTVLLDLGLEHLLPKENADMGRTYPQPLQDIGESGGPQR